MRYYKITDEGHIRTMPATQITTSDGWFIVSAKELKNYQKLFNLPNKHVEACNWKTDLPRIEIYNDYNFGLLQIIKKIGHQFGKKAFYFFLGEKYLILVLQSPVEPLEELVEKLLKDEEEHFTTAKILCRLLDHITGADASLLDELEEEIMRVEIRILENRHDDFVEQIISFRKQFMFLKKYFEPLIDLIADLEENDNNICKDKESRYFKRLSHRVTRLNEQVIHLSEYITQIRETYDSKVNAKTNEIVEWITLLTAIFLPPTMIVSWYGMNLDMPEVKWTHGYIYVILLTIISIIICVYIFKKKKWLN